MTLEVHPVTPDRWDDLVALAERPGPRGGTPILGTCWCMAYKDEKQLPLAGLRKDAMRELVLGDERPGLLAYRDGTPVGWVAVAPRPAYPVLQRSRLYGPLDGDEDVFAITCFYVDPAFRGEGVSSALLDAAVEYARQQGAKAVDAFPKVEVAAHASRSGRAEESFSFMGRPGSFERREFEVVRTTGARAVVRRSLGSDGRRTDPRPGRAARGRR